MGSVIRVRSRGSRLGFWLVASLPVLSNCGRAELDSGSGGSSSGGAAAGGPASGGSASGGAMSGGAASSGGTASGGDSAGGARSDGGSSTGGTAPSSGGSEASGGVSSGGASGAGGSGDPIDPVLVGSTERSCGGNMWSLDGQTFLDCRIGGEHESHPECVIVDCTAHGDTGAICVFSNHCLCSDGFLCAGGEKTAGECDPRWSCVPAE